MSRLDQHREREYRHVEHEGISMADGVRLSARLWIPEAAGGVLPPVVLEYIPYRKRDSYRAHDSVWGHALASRGIAFARIDVRGSGDSEGVLTDEYTRQELDDGLSVIEWLAQQQWNSGRVGMRGISWGAINTLQIAALRPPALEAVVAIAGSDNRFSDDAHYLGGLLARANLEWGVLFKSVMAAPPDPGVVGDAWKEMWFERLGATPAVIAKWCSHPEFDAYWQRGSIALDYSAIGVPVYVVAGSLDTYCNPVGRLLSNLQVPTKGLVGCWGHTYPETAVPNGVDWAAEEVRWWRHWLEDARTSIMEEPKLWVFMPDAPPVSILPEPLPGTWRAYRNWSQAGSDWYSLFPGGTLDGVATLSPDGATSADAQLVADARSVADVPSTTNRIEYVPSEPVGDGRVDWLNQLPGEQSADDARSLTFDSAPLSADLEIMGYPSVRMRLAASSATAGICIRLNDVDVKGNSWPVGYFVGTLNHLADPSRPKALQEGAFTDFEIDLDFTAHRFRNGSRIRLAISEPLWPMTLPLGERSAFTVDADSLELQLPIGHAETGGVEFPMAELSPADRNRRDIERSKIIRHADGSLSCDHVPGRYRYTESEVGTTLASHTESESQWRPGGPARWREETSKLWQREDWHCRVEAGCELVGSNQVINVEEWLRAYEGDKLVYSCVHLTEIDRSFS